MTSSRSESCKCRARPGLWAPASLAAELPTVGPGDSWGQAARALPGCLLMLSKVLPGAISPQMDTTALLYCVHVF